MVARFLHPAGQGGVTGGEQHPALRRFQDRAIGGTDGVRRGAGSESAGGYCASLRGNAFVASLTTPGCGGAASSCTVRGRTEACRALLTRRLDLHSTSMVRF